MSQQNNAKGAGLTLLTAAAPLLVYLISGRYFVRGITSGAVKG